MGSFGGERSGDGTPDVAGGAGDQRGLAFEAHSHTAAPLVVMVRRGEWTARSTIYRIVDYAVQRSILRTVAAETHITPRGAATRARIVEAAADLVLARGVGGTSLDDIRAGTATSKSKLFHYFSGGKGGII